MGVKSPVHKARSRTRQRPSMNRQSHHQRVQGSDGQGRRAGSPPRRGKVPPHRRKTRKEHLRLRPQRPRPNHRLLLRTPKPRTTDKVRPRRQTRTRPNRRRDRRIFRHAHVSEPNQTRSSSSPKPPPPTTPPSSPTRSPPSAKTPPSAAPNLKVPSPSGRGEPAPVKTGGVGKNKVPSPSESGG